MDPPACWKGSLSPWADIGRGWWGGALHRQCPDGNGLGRPADLRCCNALVFLAVWLTFAARSVAGKVCAILWPITAFVALGFEHSVTNMDLIPVGLFAGADAEISAVLSNLVAVTLGNVLGGVGGVALSYWLAYGRMDHAGRKS